MDNIAEVNQMYDAGKGFDLIQRKYGYSPQEILHIVAVYRKSKRKSEVIERKFGCSGCGFDNHSGYCCMPNGVCKRR